MNRSALPELRLRKTLIDLYNEKDDMPWYYRIGATVSAMMLAVGRFFISSSAIVQTNDSNATPSSLLVSGVVLPILAYFIFAVISIFSKSWIFQLDILYIPHLSSSVLGLISIVYALSTNRGPIGVASSSAHFATATFVLSLGSIIVYSILSILVFRKICIVRARDALHRYLPASKAAGPLHEDEEQRKQLSRLLLQHDENKVTSLDNATQTTFKIEWPGHSKLQSRRSSLSAPKLGTSFAGMSKYGSQGSHVPGSSDRQIESIEQLPTIRVEEPSGLSSWLNTGRSTSIPDLSANHITGGIERVPSRTQEDLSGDPQNAGLGLISPAQTENSRDDGPAPLRPIAFIPHSQAARNFGLESPTQPGTPQSALPSYSAHAHPSLNISTRPLSRLGENSFPIEKNESAVYAWPAPAQQRPVQEGPYRMADPG